MTCQHMPPCPPGHCPQAHDAPIPMGEVGMSPKYLWTCECGTKKEWTADNDLACPIASWWPPQ